VTTPQERPRGRTAARADTHPFMGEPFGTTASEGAMYVLRIGMVNRNATIRTARPPDALHVGRGALVESAADIEKTREKRPPKK